MTCHFQAARRSGTGRSSRLHSSRTTTVDPDFVFKIWAFAYLRSTILGCFVIVKSNSPVSVVWFFGINQGEFWWTIPYQANEYLSQWAGKGTLKTELPKMPVPCIAQRKSATHTFLWVVGRKTMTKHESTDEHGQIHKPIKIHVWYIYIYLPTDFLYWC